MDVSYNLLEGLVLTPGWTLGWTWTKKEVIWDMLGVQTTEQGDCSTFKGDIPDCCKKDPTVVDLLPGTPYNKQIANCCKSGVISSQGQDPANAPSAFQITVGSAWTTNKIVRTPKDFTLRAPRPGYTCGVAEIVKPSKFISEDGRRTTQALMTWNLFPIPCSEVPDMMRLPLFFLQRHNRQLPNMHLWLSEKSDTTWKLCRGQFALFSFRPQLACSALIICDLDHNGCICRCFKDGDLRFNCKPEDCS